MKSARWWMAVAAVLWAASGAPGDEIRLEQAEVAVGRWMARGGGFGAAGRDGALRGETLEDAASGGRWHVVRTDGGYAVTTADDGLEPIVAFGEGEADWLEDAGHPFWTLLRADYALRTGGGAGKAGGAPRRGGISVGSTETKAEWADLLGKRTGARAAGNGQGIIQDIRHGAMLTTIWNQQKNTVGNYRYNMYLPYPADGTLGKGLARDGGQDGDNGEGDNGEGEGEDGNNDGESGGEDDGDDDDDDGIHVSWSYSRMRAPAGCVAVAGGQLMNWWRKPSVKIAKVDRTCRAFGRQTNMTTKAGTYAWDRMGGREPRTESQGRAVSKLLHDVAVACEAYFEEETTSMSSYAFVSSLTEVFGYSNAKWTQLGAYNAETLRRAIVPNLDAGAPVMLSITNANPRRSHEVLVDGCGTDGNHFAIHLNLGWGGSGTMWYKPPAIYPNEEQNYNYLCDLAYNISPTERGEIVSGRVLGPNGRPVSRPTVEILGNGGTVAWRGTGGPDGIYAWWGAGAGTYTVRATAGGASGEATAKVKESTSDVVGNALCDVVLAGAETAPEVSWSWSSARGLQTGTFGEAKTVSLSCATPGAEIRYTLDGSEPTASSALYGEDGPIVVQATTTLKAATFVDGKERGETAEMQWTFEDTASRDDFASARTIVGARGKAVFQNTGYGKERGEPTHSPEEYPGGASAWAKWTAPAAGKWTFSLSGTDTDGGELDTQLAVYTGTSVAALTRIAANDDTLNSLSSKTAFSAVEGKEYRIAMDTYQGVGGEMTLEWGTSETETASFSQNAQFMPSSGGRIALRVTSTADWTLPDVSGWLHASPESGADGDGVEIEVEPNDEGETREGSVCVCAGNIEDAEAGVFQVIQSELDFCTNRVTAVARATAEGKRILMVWGREGCGNTWATLLDNLPSEGVRERLEAGYVLWYSNCDRQGDGDSFAIWGTLPTVAVLAPSATGSAVKATNGYQSATALASLLGNVVVFRSEEEDRVVAVRYPASGESLGTLPNAERDGFGLDGWTTAPGGGGKTVTTATVPGDGVTTYYARWGVAKQKVTFRGNGGTPDTQSRTYDVGGTYSPLPDASREAHRFDGWWTAAGGGTNVTAETMVTADPTRTLWAHWKEDPKPNLAFRAAEGWPSAAYLAATEGGAGAVTNFWEGDTVYLNFGYANDGAVAAAAHGVAATVKDAAGTVATNWSLAAQRMDVNAWRGMTNIALTAGAAGRYTVSIALDPSGVLAESSEKDNAWQLAFTVAAVQTVTFDANGGMCETPEKAYRSGFPYGELPVATRAGQAFDGWWTKKSGGTRVTAATKATDAAARTFYAHWMKTQTAKFNANGGKCGTASKTYTIGKAYGSLPKATKAGAGFAGWADEEGNAVTATSLVTEETLRTLHAQWTTVQTVVFDANGGECGTPSGEFAIGAAYGELPVATKAGQALVGWFTAKKDGTKVTEASKATEAATRTLYAHWTAKQTVKFNANGGKCGTSSKTYTIGKAYGSLPTATKKGYGHAGWATAAEGGNEVTAASIVTEETPRELFAQWTTVQTVTFDANGGECGTASGKFVIGSAYGELPTATKAGQALVGWYTAKKDGAKVTEASKATETATRTLYAHWTAKQTAKFNANGGKCGTSSKTYTIGKAYGSLPTATKKGYGHFGWADASEGGNAVTAASIVTEETPRELFAQWTTVQTVTFDANGGECGTASDTFAIGAPYEELPTATKAGQALVGWYTAKKDGAKVTGTSKATEAATRTLYAHWTTKQTAKFNANGGKCSTSSKTYTIGKAYGSLPSATKKGYGHAGWADAAEGGAAVTAASLVTEETPRNLYAQWTTNQVVVFDANGGECDTPSGIYAIGAPYGELPVATRAGYALTGWYTAKKDGTKVTEASKATEAATRTLYAHWTAMQTAKFNANGGKCGTSSKTYTIGKAYGSLPKATKKGFGHAGWADAAEGGATVTTESLVTEETPRTLYAQWTTSQTVTFDANGGECVAPSGMFAIGAPYGELPVAMRAGYALTGWYTAKKDGTKVTEASKATEAATRTLYAHWTAKQTVKFNANGGKCSTSSKTYAIGNPYGSLPVPTWKGCVFTGWADAKEGGEYVTKEDLVTAAASRSLWAQWAAAKAGKTGLISGISVKTRASGVQARGAAGSGEGTCVLVVETETGVEYELQWTPELCGEWMTVRRWRAGTDGECEIEVPVETGMGFYRLTAGEAVNAGSDSGTGGEAGGGEND